MHYCTELPVLVSYFANYVYGTHDQLVEMTVSKQGKSVVRDRVLQISPYFFQVLLSQVQHFAQGLQSCGGKVVKLEYSKKNYWNWNLLAHCVTSNLPFWGTLLGDQLLWVWYRLSTGLEWWQSHRSAQKSGCISDHHRPEWLQELID